MTASDRGPDSPATTRFRAFYDWPAPVEFNAELPDDIDGPPDERDFLLDAAPFAKLAAVRVERVALPSSSAAPGRTPVPADTEGRDGGEALSDDLSRERAMARVMDPNAHDDTFPMHPDRRVERLDSALAHAIAAVDAGYRLVSEDDATVERVARVLHDRLCDRADGDEACEDYDDHRWYKADARAAVRALREAGTDG